MRFSLHQPIAQPITYRTKTMQLKNKVMYRLVYKQWACLKNTAIVRKSRRTSHDRA